MQTSGLIAAMVVGAAAMSDMSEPRVDESPEALASAGSDDAVMTRVRAGDRGAFRAIVERYQRDIVAFVTRFTSDPSLARDVAQEVFLTLWNERERYDERGKLRLYLLRIARLRALAALKKRRSRARLSALLASERLDSRRVGNADSALDAGRAAERLYRGIARLAPKYAEVVILRHLQGLGLDEIAEVTGLRAGTIKSRLGRGLAALRKEIARD